MTYQQFIKPEVVTIGGREYTLSKIPAFTAKPIYTELVNLVRDNGDIGRTMLSDESAKAIFRHVAVKGDDGEQRVLDNVALIERHLVEQRDFYEVMLKMEDYNFGFLTDGTLRDLLGLPAEGELESAS